MVKNAVQRAITWERETKPQRVHRPVIVAMSTSGKIESQRRFSLPWILRTSRQVFRRHFKQEHGVRNRPRLYWKWVPDVN